MITKTKSFSLNAVEGADITPDMLTLINKYSMKQLAVDDIYVRKYLMAHNGIDRDRERFPETILNDFARTLPGKSLLSGHQRPNPGIGLYFDAATEEISPDKFKQLTGEDINLPDNVSTAKILWGWIYMVKADFNAAIISNIEAGIYRHASIGFSASDLIQIKGEFGQILYREYVPPGDAREGSLVWLGAQPGATSQKSTEQFSDRNENKKDRDCDYWENPQKNPLFFLRNEQKKIP